MLNKRFANVKNYNKSLVNLHVSFTNFFYDKLDLNLFSVENT